MNSDITVDSYQLLKDAQKAHNHIENQYTLLTDFSSSLSSTEYHQIFHSSVDELEQAERTIEGIINILEDNTHTDLGNAELSGYRNQIRNVQNLDVQRQYNQERIFSPCQWIYFGIRSIMGMLFGRSAQILAYNELENNDN